MAKASTAGVIAEGNFFKEQFPLNSTTPRDQTQFEALVAARIAEAMSEIRSRVGATTYASTDTDTNALLTTAETYLAVSKLYNTMLNIIAAWDAEVLPSEFVESDVCERQRDWYDGEVDRITGPLAVVPGSAVVLPRFIVDGVAIEAT